MFTSRGQLYTFVDTAYLHGRSVAEVARELCAGGSDIIQLRAKDHSPDDVRRLTAEVLPVTRSARIPLVINDHPSIAAEFGVEFCHLGQEDFFDAGYSAISEISAAKAGVRFGLSTHAPDQARRAIQALPAYVAIGPIYPTGTKPTARPVTLDYVRWAAENVTLPWFAIGGIHEGNLDEVIGAGAHGICVVSAILNAPSIARACQSLKNQLASSLS